jgi:threonine dehydrogenase-like Zn-dependent dehydrogenase
LKQVTWHGKNIFTLDDVPDLNPQEGWVKIKIDTVGICGTDVHITQGLFPATPPQVLGHEASGIISEVGIGVDKKRIGERVTINTSSSCGNCKNCIDWTISRCENAERSTPFFSEFSFAPNQNAIKIPDDLDLEIACMTEPASCCLSGVKMLSNLENSRALVIGGGIMGQFCAGFLKTHGAKEVIMSEPIKSRREISKDMNVDILHDPKESNLEEFIDDLTDSKGIDIAIEAVGKPELVDKCIKISKPGGQVLMIGVNPAKSNLKTDLYEMHYREITLKGAFGRGNVFHQTPKALQKLKLTNMISKRYPLNQVKKAIYDSSLGKGIKLVVKP